MKNNKVKRYTLVQYEGESSSFFPYIEAAAVFVERLKALNTKKDEQFFCKDFDISLSKNGYVVRYKRYLKLSEPMFLEDIDNITTKYKSFEQMSEDYFNIGNVPFEIAYRYNCGINLLDVFYKSDSKFMDSNYLRQSLVKQSLDSDLVFELYGDSYIFKHKKSGLNEVLDRMLTAKKDKFSKESIETCIYDFYRIFVKKKDGSLDYRAKRYLAEMIRKREQNDLSHFDDENIQLTFRNHSGHKTTN